MNRFIFNRFGNVTLSSAPLLLAVVAAALAPSERALAVPHATNGSWVINGATLSTTLA